jgi:hypothetical protein
MAIIGKHARFRLRHGPNVREFRDVVVSRPKVAARDDAGRVLFDEKGDKVMVEHPEADRYELIGTEVLPPGPGPREQDVTVGFMADMVVEG